MAMKHLGMVGAACHSAGRPVHDIQERVTGATRAASHTHTQTHTGVPAPRVTQ